MVVSSGVISELPISSAPAAGGATTHNLAATITSASTVVGALTVVVNHELTATITGASTVVGVLTTSIDHELTATITSASTVVGALSVVAAAGTDEIDDGTILVSFDAAGFTVGASNTANELNDTFLAIGFLRSTAAGFSIVREDGTGVARNVAHTLGVAPEMFWAINRDKYAATNIPHMYHVGMDATAPEDFYDVPAVNTISRTNLAADWNDTPPDGTNMTVGTSIHTNGSGDKMLYYSWAPIKGLSYFGRYIGNASTDGPVLWCGFKPRLLILRMVSSSGTAEWHMYWYDPDSGVLTGNANNPATTYNTLASQAVPTGSGRDIDFLSTGAKIRTANAALNTSAGEYIYAAFAETPITYGSAV